MLSRLQKISILDAVAFITGFALMAYELVASRLLAPTIGSSTYVWTSVIGVIIAALSLGYSFGGIVADKRVRILDISYLLVASACAMLATIAIADGTLGFISTHIHDPRLQGLTASLVLFMPASFLIGMISPYLVRLRTVSVASTGRSVASLSALNAIGGIMGTFCAGFLFFGYVGVRETVGFLSVVLVAASWAIEPKKALQMRILLTFIGVAIAANAFAPETNAAVKDVDTPSAHYQIVDGTYNNNPVRVLASGPSGAQSGVFTNGKQDLVFPYTKQIASIIDNAPQKDRILVLGGGTFTIPDYVAKKYPNTHIDVVEIDPKLLDISKEHFGYQPRNNISHIFTDARAYINSTPNKYDLIIIDVYGDISIPFAVTTTEYVTMLQKRLTPTGAVIANIIAGSSDGCRSLLGSLNGTYREHFVFNRAFSMQNWESGESQNLISVYSSTPLYWIKHSNNEVYNLPATTVLTDNYAPLERFEQTCR